MDIEYASNSTVYKLRKWRWWILLAVVGVYISSYLIVRTVVKPEANMEYFVYSDSMLIDQCCYCGFWPLYKIDRIFMGRKHNLDRTPFVMIKGP